MIEARGRAFSPAFVFDGPYEQNGGSYRSQAQPHAALAAVRGRYTVPMPVRAPGKVSAGQVSSIKWAFWDILPTLTDLTHSPTLSGIDGLSYSKALNK